MKLNKTQIKFALIFMSRYEIKTMSKLSLKDFIKSCKKNKKSEQIDDESFERMHELIKKKAK